MAHTKANARHAVRAIERAALLFFLLSAPLIALVYWSASVQDRVDRGARQEQLDHLAHLISARLDDRLAQIDDVALALSVRLANHPAEEPYEALGESRSLVPRYVSDARVWRPLADMVGAPPSAPAALSARPAQLPSTYRATGYPALTVQMPRDLVSENPQASARFWRPLYDTRGRITGYLCLTVALADFDQFLNLEGALADGLRISIRDEDGTILAQNTDQDAGSPPWGGYPAGRRWAERPVAWSPSEPKVENADDSPGRWTSGVAPWFVQVERQPPDQSIPFGAHPVQLFAAAMAILWGVAWVLAGVFAGVLPARARQRVAGAHDDRDIIAAADQAGVGRDHLDDLDRRGDRARVAAFSHALAGQSLRAGKQLSSEAGHPALPAQLGPAIGGGADVPGLFALREELTAGEEAEGAQAGHESGPEQALPLARTSPGRLQTLVDNIPALLAYVDSEERFLFANRTYASWFGEERYSPVGQTLLEYFGSSVYQSMRSAVRAALAGAGATYERDVATVRGTLHAQVTMVPDVGPHGSVEGLFVLVNDVTELKATNRALIHEALVQEVIFSNAGVGIAFVRDRQLRKVSRRFCELLGYQASELEGKSTSIIYPDEAAYDKIGRLAAELFPVIGALDHELYLRRKDGSTFWGRLVGQPVDPADRSQGTIWIIDDFSDRKQRQLLLEASREAAQEAARTKGQFLANMSHEIRTPMNAIIGMTELTLESELKATQRENLLMVQEAAGALLHLLNDILDFSKLDARKLELRKEEFDLTERLATTLQSYGLQAQAKGIALVLDIAPDVPARVIGDPDRLMQVVTNLVSNAIKFTHTGEVICQVEATRQTSERARLSFAFSDTGIGIPEHACEGIFESFVQADNSVTRRYGGTGLGLAICTQLVNLMGGEIDLSSTLGKGSTFRFVIELSKPAHDPAQSGIESVLAKDRSILVAIANLSARRAVVRQLRTWHLDALEFDAVEDALQAARLASKHGAGYRVLLADRTTHAQGPHAATEPKAIVRILLGADPTLAKEGWRFIRSPVRPSDLRAQLLEILADEPRPASLIQNEKAFGPGQSSRGLQVLLAEDNPLNQRLAQRILTNRGHIVTVVEDGKKAVAAAAQGAFDIILMDVQMPEMDGETAVKAIRAAESLTGRHTPIVALTAHALKGEREHLLHVGMDDYLSKPYRPKDLLEIVSRLAIPPRQCQNSSDPTRTLPPPN